MAQDGETVMADPGRARAPRLLFASCHCYLDPSSGAAIAARDLLELLASHGWSVRVFCGPALDFERGESLAQLLSDQGIAFEERTCREGRIDALAGRNACPPFSLFHFRQNGVPVSVFVPSGPGKQPLPRAEAGASARGATKLGLTPQPTTASEGAAFLALFERVLDEYRPDVLLT